MHIKQPSFDSVDAHLSVVDVVAELASHEECLCGVSSSFRLDRRARRNGLKNVVEPTVLQGNGETAAAISPDIAVQDLRFGV
jgi:hypothetical protein